MFELLGLILALCTLCVVAIGVLIKAYTSPQLREKADLNPDSFLSKIFGRLDLILLNEETSKSRSIAPTIRIIATDDIGAELTEVSSITVSTARAVHRIVKEGTPLIQSSEAAMIMDAEIIEITLSSPYRKRIFKLFSIASLLTFFISIGATILFAISGLLFLALLLALLAALVMVLGTSILAEIAPLTNARIILAIGFDSVVVISGRHYDVRYPSAGFMFSTINEIIYIGLRLSNGESDYNLFRYPRALQSFLFSFQELSEMAENLNSIVEKRLHEKKSA